MKSDLGQMFAPEECPGEESLGDKHMLAKYVQEPDSLRDRSIWLSCLCKKSFWGIESRWPSQSTRVKSMC